MKDFNVDKHLFWDVDFETMDLDRSSVYIIGRVFNYGSMNDAKEIVKRYGVDRVKRDIVKNTDLRNNTMNFVSEVFNIPLKDFRAYIRRQENPVQFPENIG